MSKEYIFFNASKKYSNYNNVLTDIADKLESIVLNKYDINEIKEDLTDIIIMMNRIINENKNNLKKVNSEIEKLNMKSYNQSSDERTEFKDGIFIGKIINNKKEGRGKFLFNNKETYEGEYENNLR